MEMITNYGIDLLKESIYCMREHLSELYDEHGWESLLELDSIVEKYNKFEDNEWDEDTKFLKGDMIQCQLERLVDAVDYDDIIEEAIEVLECGLDEDNE